MHQPYPRRALSAALAALAVIAVAAAPASAGPLVATAASCADRQLEQPFLRWIDPARYVLAPDGTFEAGAPSWSLNSGVSTVNGNEPFNVHGDGETRSLAIPSGSSATSGSMCVGLEHPTLRFFAKRTPGTLGSLRVDVLFEDASGTTRSLKIGSVARTTSSWAPTAPMLVTANLLALLPGEHTAVAFRFVSQGSASWSIDDVYVDPFYR